MAKDEDQVIARVPPDMIARLDALIDRLNADASIRMGVGPRGVTRSTVLRMALAEGLPVLESKYRARRGRRER